MSLFSHLPSSQTPQTNYLITATANLSISTIWLYRTKSSSFYAIVTTILYTSLLNFIHVDLTSYLIYNLVDTNS